MSADQDVPDFARRLVNLASPRLGSQAVAAIHEFDGRSLGSLGAVNYVKLNIFPDGEVSRLRVFGRLA